MPAPIVREPSFWESAKAAFLFHWNLLFFGAGMALGVLVGKPDVVCPLVAAGELGYLALLISRPRFRAAIAAQRHAETAQITQTSNEELMKRMVSTLSRSEKERLQQLTDRCVRLREITRGLHATGGEESPLEDIRLQGADKLLWMHIKLLYTKHMMEQFFDNTDADALAKDYAALQKRLDGLGPPDKDSPHAAEVRRSLEDNVATSKARIDNYHRARDNYDFIELELNRLENKINGVLEAAVNRQDPGFITSQVNAIAGSMSQTEKTMGELQFLTGLDDREESVPPIVSKVTQ